MNRINLRTCPLATLAALAVAVTPSSAQRVLDVPVRTGVGADALAVGPVAVFWNAGSIDVPAGRGEALIVDTRGPGPTGLDGIGVAGTWRLDARTAIAAGLQHAGIDDIERTTTSPLPGDGAVPLDVSETTFSVGALRQVGPRTAVGATVRYTRVAEVVGGDDVAAIGAGVRHDIPSRAGFIPTVAGSVLLDEDGADWSAGAEIARPIGERADWSVGAEYGVRGSPRFQGIEHRLAVTGGLRDRLRLGAGVAMEPGAEGYTVEPAGSVSLSIHRYVLGVVREQLPNDLGPVHQFRFSVMF